MIYARSAALDHLAVVVLDEVHFLQDTYRGPVWEEVIIHLPTRVRLVCLSATVSNAAELAEWISTVRGPTTAIVEDRRPVKLDNLYLIGDKTHDRMHLLPTLVNGRPNHDAARLDEEAARNAKGSRPRRGAAQARRRLFTPSRLEVVELLEQHQHAAGDLLHLQPQPVRRGGQGGDGRRHPADDRRRARSHPRDRRRPARGDRSGRPGRARLQHLPRPARGRRRRPPRRHGAAVQGGGRGLLRRGPGEGGVRHRDAGGRHQHAGQDRRDREADQVHRRSSRVPDAGRVHPAHRPGRPAGHRRPRLRRGAVEPVRAVRPGRRAGQQPHVPPQLGLPADVQHGRQPGALVHQRARPPPAQPVVRPVPGRRRRGAHRGPTRATPDPPRRSAGAGAAARTATSTSTAGR